MLKKIVNSLPVAYVETFILILIGQALGGILIYFICAAAVAAIPSLATTDYWITGQMYAMFIGMWIVGFLYMFLIKPYRPFLKFVGRKAKGNTIGKFFLGLFIGFAANGGCILIAWLHKDIALYFDSFRPLPLLCVFVLVFIQSSAEELLCRGFLYQKLMKTYKNPYVAIVGNSLLFALLHLGNEGVTLLSVLNIFLSGILMSLPVYFMDSLWCAMAIHVAWNYTQNILFGLPNSGIVVPFSLFKLDAASATNSFAYNVGFGIEGTLTADIVLLLACVIFWCAASKGKKNEEKSKDKKEKDLIH